jgi:hypothetical protein
MADTMRSQSIHTCLISCAQLTRQLAGCQQQLHRQLACGKAEQQQQAGQRQPALFERKWVALDVQKIDVTTAFSSHSQPGRSPCNSALPSEGHEAPDPLTRIPAPSMPLMSVNAASVSL